MGKLRRHSTAIGLVAALMTVTGLASATEHDVPEDDTLLVAGYDAVNGILITGISDALAGAWDCSVPASGEGEDPIVFDVTYGDENGTVPVDTLVQQGDPDPIDVEFTANPDADPPNEDPDGVAEYGDAAECALTGVSVAGNNGQVNHGKIVSAFAKLLKSYEGKRGCLMRLMAHTDFGKGDQQVKPSDVDQPFEPTIAEEGSLTLENMPTMCRKGPKAPKDNPGQLKKAERLAEGAAPGNSGNAPGRNKD